MVKGDGDMGLTGRRGCGTLAMMVPPDNTLAQKIVDLLNELIKQDPDAMSALISARVPCGELLADHPTVQVGETDTGYEVGLLGILNGLCGADSKGRGFVAVTVEEGGRVTGATLLIDRIIDEDEDGESIDGSVL